MDPDVRKIIQAHSTLVKMFYRRSKTWSAKMVDGTKMKISPPAGKTPAEVDRDLRVKSDEIRKINLELAEESHYEERDVLEAFSGIYGDILVNFVYSLSNNEAQKALGMAADHKLNKITVVWTQTQTAPSKPLIEQAMRATSIFFDSFSVSKLAIDVTEHSWVPNHRLVSDPAERKKILQGYSIDEDSILKLPKLLPSDVICEYFAFPAGSIIEVTRPGPMGPNLVHRVVSSDSSSDSYDPESAKEKEVVHPDDRKYTKYLTPPEYAMAIAGTASIIAKSEPPPKYLEGPERRLLKIAKAMVDDQQSDVVIARPHVNSNKEEHWHLGEMVLPKVS